MTDAHDPQPVDTRRLLRLVPIALAVALALAWVAPDDWESGRGVLEVEYSGEVAVSAPIDLDTGDFFAASGEAQDATITVEVPDGFELDRTVGVTVDIVDPGVAVETGDLEVAIITPTGSRQILPLFESESGGFEASRRPPVGSGPVLAILGVAIVLWVTEAVPLFVTSLAIPIALAVSEVGTATEALAPFFDPIIVLFFGGFLLAEAMRRARLDRLVAITIVALAGDKAVRLYLALIALAAFMSMWMSNTAAVTVLIPIAMAVTEPLDAPDYRKATILGIAYAATIGGVGSAIGTPANQLAISFLDELTGRRIDFAEWFGFGLPMVLAFLPIMALYLWKASGVDVPADRFRRTASIAKQERASLGPLTPAQVQVVVVFGLVMALWLTQSLHGVNTAIVALGGVVALVVLGRIEATDLSRISWASLLTFGGGLTLGRFMVTTGTSDWMVTGLDGLGALPNVVAVLAVAAVALGLTTAASNTAAAATLIPLAVPLAAIIGVDPVLLVVVVAVASSIDFALVIGTPPTMLAYSTELFTAREILRRGAPLDAIGIAVLIAIVIPVWRLLGLV